MSVQRLRTAFVAMALCISLVVTSCAQPNSQAPDAASEPARNAAAPAGDGVPYVRAASLFSSNPAEANQALNDMMTGLGKSVAIGVGKAAFAQFLVATGHQAWAVDLGLVDGNALKLDEINKKLDGIKVQLDQISSQVTAVMKGLNQLEVKFDDFVKTNAADNQAVQCNNAKRNATNQVSMIKSASTDFTAALKERANAQAVAGGLDTNRDGKADSSPLYAKFVEVWGGTKLSDQLAMLQGHMTGDSGIVRECAAAAYLTVALPGNVSTVSRQAEMAAWANLGRYYGYQTQAIRMLQAIKFQEILDASKKEETKSLLAAKRDTLGEASADDKVAALTDALCQQNTAACNQLQLGLSERYIFDTTPDSNSVTMQMDELGASYGLVWPELVSAASYSADAQPHGDINRVYASSLSTFAHCARDEDGKLTGGSISSKAGASAGNCPNRDQVIWNPNRENNYGRLNGFGRLQPANPTQLRGLLRMKEGEKLSETMARRSLTDTNDLIIYAPGAGNRSLGFERLTTKGSSYLDAEDDLKIKEVPGSGGPYVTPVGLPAGNLSCFVDTNMTLRGGLDTTSYHWNLRGIVETPLGMGFHEARNAANHGDFRSDPPRGPLDCDGDVDGIKRLVQPTTQGSPIIGIQGKSARNGLLRWWPLADIKSERSGNWKRALETTIPRHNNGIQVSLAQNSVEGMTDPAFWTKGTYGFYQEVVPKENLPGWATGQQQFAWPTANIADGQAGVRCAGSPATKTWGASINVKTLVVCQGEWVEFRDKLLPAKVEPGPTDVKLVQHSTRPVCDYSFPMKPASPARQKLAVSSRLTFAGNGKQVTYPESRTIDLSQRKDDVFRGTFRLGFGANDWKFTLRKDGVLTKPDSDGNFTYETSCSVTLNYVGVRGQSLATTVTTNPKEMKVPESE